MAERCFRSFQRGQGILRRCTFTYHTILYRRHKEMVSHRMCQSTQYKLGRFSGCTQCRIQVIEPSQVLRNILVHTLFVVKMAVLIIRFETCQMTAKKSYIYLDYYLSKTNISMHAITSNIEHQDIYCTVSVQSPSVHIQFFLNTLYSPSCSADAIGSLALYLFSFQFGFVHFIIFSSFLSISKLCFLSDIKCHLLWCET